MTSKEIDVTCPCCQARLTVDTRTSQVMRARPAEQHGDQPKDAWAEAQAKVRDRTTRSQDRLDTALEQEKTKEARFDELFRKAAEKRKRLEDET